MRTRVLMTGFEPFEAASINESWEAVRTAEALLVEDPDAAHANGPIDLAVRRLPVVFGVAADHLLEAMRVLRPDLVVAVGLAGGRTAVTPERVAINVQDARIPDNAGASPVDEPCAADGADGLFSSLPIKAMVQAARADGMCAQVSQTAGTFVCNDVFYRLQHALRTEPAFAGIRGGFVHVPLAAQVPVPDQGRALAAMVRAAVSTRTDVTVSGGAEH